MIPACCCAQHLLSWQHISSHKAPELLIINTNNGAYCNCAPCSLEYCSPQKKTQSGFYLFCYGIMVLHRNQGFHIQYSEILFSSVFLWIGFLFHSTSWTYGQACSFAFPKKESLLREFLSRTPRFVELGLQKTFLEHKTEAKPAALTLLVFLVIHLPVLSQAGD